MFVLVLHFGRGMDWSPWPPVRTLGQPTSVELARQQEYSIQSITEPKNHPKHAFNTVKSAGVLPTNPQTLPSRLPPRLQPSLIVDTPSANPASSRCCGQQECVSTTSENSALLSLYHKRYSLPSILVDNLRRLGIYSIYPWQAACLSGRGVLGGRQNLIYTAPTGGGKSLVADILLLKKIIGQPGKKALLVLPYVALVQEKLKWLRNVTENVLKDSDMLEQSSGQPHLASKRKDKDKSIRLAASFGGSRSKILWSEVDIVVCTIEKANMLVNSAIEDGTIGQLGVVVVDELHMIDDEHRGYIMELMLTKMLCLECDVQIVGMSATLSNPEMLAGWLGAKFYISKYRPIHMEEYMVYDGGIYPTLDAKQFFQATGQLTSISATPKPPQPMRSILKSSHRELENSLTNAVVSLAVETAESGYGALVFCSSRQGCQTTAALISKAMPVTIVNPQVLDRRMDVLASLQALPGGFEAAFTETVPCGVAFHHAGLTVEERDIVAEAFDAAVLKVMVATCSLAAGINLPARRVIINGARMGRDLVGPAMLRQMRGRAGRKGKDEIGESYVCCQKADLEAVAELLEAEMPAVESCLTPERRGVKRSLLEAIAVRLVCHRESVEHYVKQSLLWNTASPEVVLSMMNVAIDELLETRLIELQEYGLLQPTRLGSAIVAASLTPEDGIFVHDELRRALECFVMDSEMHSFYLFTPVQATGLSEIFWPAFRDQLDQLDESGIRALRCIGVNPALVNKLANSGATLKETAPEEVDLARTYQRAYSAFQLRDLCNEIPIHTISLKYSVPRGAVQNLAQTCHGFAAGMIKFCERMGWGVLAAVLNHMVDRLHAGARADLLEMAQVTYVKSRMARIFWENGFKSVRALAEADPGNLVPIMMQAQNKKAKRPGDAAKKLQEKLQEKAEIIVNSANRLYERQQLAELDEL